MIDRRVVALGALVLVSTVLVALPAAGSVPKCDGLPATIVGTSSDDVLIGTAGKDVIVGRAGADLIKGFDGPDVICGGAGADTLIGNAGADRLFGENGADRIEGRRGHDVLMGGGGDDELLGGGGRDRLEGGLGPDTADGGAGIDYCDAATESRCDDTDPGYYITPTVRASGPTISVAAGANLSGALAAAQAGDTLALAPGTHTASGNLVLSNSGTATEWIRIVAADPADPPVIDLGGSGEFRISGSYVLLEGVQIRNGGGNNLHIAPGSADVHHVIVRHTTISDLAWGPGAAIKLNRNNPQGAGVDRVYLEHNDVSEALSNAVIDGVGVSRAVVRGNYIHDNVQGSHGVFFKGGSSKVLLEGNLIAGIRGNAALQLGGNTGAGFFDPAFAGWEGVDQVARNNLIADFDDSAIEIRGVKNGTVVHNTVVTQTDFAIVRLSTGNTNSGGTVGNDNIVVANNLIVGTGGDPQYARNDGGPVTIDFGPQLWAGLFHNSGSPTPNIPQFPQAGDVVVGVGALSSVLVDPTHGGHDGLTGAIARYTPAAASPALGAGSWRGDALLDLIAIVRSVNASLGAVERP